MSSNPSVGRGALAGSGRARAWGPITAALLVAFAVALIALLALVANQAEQPWAPLQFLVRREQTDARTTIDPDRQAPVPLPPGNVIGKDGGTRGVVPGGAEAPSGGLDTSLGGGGGTGPTGAGPAGTRP
jgi:hypothetical protein